MAPSTAVEVQLIEVCSDPDPRVRADAIRQLERLCSNGADFLSLGAYATVRELCANSSLNVRLSALRILGKFGLKYGEEKVKNQLNFEVRLHDDAFTVMCNAVNDTEIEVRTEATQSLGQFVHVSDAFLHQTLDKKIMNAMKVGVDGARRIGGGGGGWSTGKKLGEAAPDKPADDEDEENSMIPAGACGAFVTALEDEFMSVRLGAVYSLGILAAKRPDFARAAIDHLADMFNDEMQEVRFASIKALTPMVIHGKLDSQQLLAILNVLSDATADNRFALHELLGLSHLNDAGCVEQVLKALLESLRRFPHDRDSVYRCLSLIGRNHACAVQALAINLFALDPKLDVQEHNLYDDFYLGRLILALNAAAVHPPIRAILPANIGRHYRFVRCANRAFIPEIADYERNRTDGGLGLMRTPAKAERMDVDVKPLDVKPLQPLQLNAPTSIAVPADHLATIYERIVESYANQRADERAALLELIIRDLNISASVEEHIAVPIRLLRSFAQLLVNYDAALHFKFDHVATLRLIEEALEIISQLRFLFNGVPESLLVFLTECGFQLNVQFLLVRLQLDPTIEETVVQSIAEEIARINENVAATTKTEFSSNSLAFTAWLVTFLQSHSTAAASSADGDGKPEKKAAALPPLVNNTHVALRKLSEMQLVLPPRIPQLRRCTMRTVLLTDINDGQGQQLGGPEHVHRFVAGIPTGVQLNAHVFNLTPEDERNFRVELIYPDEWHDFQQPQPFELERLSGRLCRLRMTLLLHAEQWCDPADVRIRCGVVTNPRAAGEDEEKAVLSFSTAASITSASASSAAAAFAFGAAKRTPVPAFVPLNDAHRPAETFQKSIRIYPMNRC
ncbi:hypothetical protein M3Y99_01357000 [Aphelenchoides fujianensis]|nr:hypothetical protein M3Y99_01357000 [Aphelenchoides fujianensis]